LNLPASGLKKVQLIDGLNQEKLKVLSCRTGNGLQENVLCWILLGEIFVDKLLIVKKDKFLRFRLLVTEDSERVKNPTPILWNHQGMYGWIPIEVIKNEIQQAFDNKKIYSDSVLFELHFTWQQTYRLRPDVGKMLESLAQSNNQSDNSPQSNSPS